MSASTLSSDSYALLATLQLQRVASTRLLQEQLAIGHALIDKLTRLQDAGLVRLRGEQQWSLTAEGTLALILGVRAGLCPAPDWAEAINATTAGRRPFKTPLIAPISPYFASSFANAIIIISEGVTKPAVAATAPPIPATFVPTKVAALIPIGPGVICEIATTSINSLNDIQ
mgnify:CR=1 FL=1